MSARAVCRIVNISDEGKVLAPGHHLCESARLSIEGLGRSFVAAKVTSNGFELREVQRVALQSFDAQSGVLRTAVPHRLSKNDDISLLGMSHRGEIYDVSYSMSFNLNILDERTICLDAGREAYTPPHTLKHIAEFEDHVLTGGVLVHRSPKPVDLSQRGQVGRLLWAEEEGGRAQAAARWVQSLRVVGSKWRLHRFRHLTPAAPKPWEPCEPEDFASSALALDFCDAFEGVYLPSAEGEVDAWRWLGIEQAHVRGCAVLGFCRDIGWGLWADLWTAGLWLYPLEHAMEDAQLSRPSGGLQLLYRCLHPSPLGAWEAVLGAEPAPQVCVALKADPPEAASDWQDLLGPILGFLLDFHSASWRGFVHQRALNGLSAMEIASRLSHLLADTFAVRCVCRRFLASSRRCSGRWRGALHQLLQLPRRLYKPSEASGMDLSRPFTRSMQLLPTDALRYIMALLTDVNVAALEQSCAFLAKIHGQHRRFEISWKQSLHAMRSRMVALSKTRLSWLSCLSLTAEAHFRRHHWAASITAVKVSTKVLGGAGKMFECEESKGLHKAWPHCVRFAHRLLKQVPVSWDREAFANSESRTTENGIPKETVFSGNLVSTPSCLKSRGQLLLFGDLLWRRDGVPLESEAPAAAHEMLAQLEGEGTYLGRRRGFGSRRCMPGANRCHWAVCAENMGLSAGDHDARTCPACSETRGFSTLCASFVNSFEFQLPEMTKPLVVDIELEAFVLPFLFTSTDFEQRCLPFRVLEEETEISEDTWGEEDMSDGPD